MLYYGACYYPEHWTAEQAKNDIPLMKKAGINVVRMGEFAWCKFEPEQGRYKFDWLDPVIAALHKAGIATVLGTPTAIPPHWALMRHPDILQVDRFGHTINQGARCHCCKNAPGYQMLAESVTRAIGLHYAGMDGVIGWQVDNEFGCHESTRCYCEHCAKAFREWLLEKYKAEEALNMAWGTAFWGFEFRNWPEVPLPRHMPTGPNPGHWLDFARFSSDTQVRFQRSLSQALKNTCPKHFVTHNYMGRFSQIDYYKLSEHVDFPTWDNYPDAHADPLEPAYGHEITRSFKNKFWVMEQKSGPTGDAETGLLGEQPEPGEIRRWAWQAIANGADGLCYFRWRACLTGAEQYWHGMLDHDGVPRRRYVEIAKTGEEFARISEHVAETRVPARVALIRDFDTLWSCERQPTAPDSNYDHHCFELYRAVKRTGNSCRVLSRGEDVSSYAVVLAPCLALVDKDVVERLKAFVSNGGTLVLTPRSGTRTVSNTMTPFTPPGLLAELAGTTIEEVRPYHHGQTDEIQFTDGKLKGQTCTVGRWVEVLKCASAKPVAEYAADRFYKGRPAIACNTLGKGKVYYIGVFLPMDALEAFVSDILPAFPIAPIPEGVEATCRKGKNGLYVFLLNHSSSQQVVKLPGKYTDLLSGEGIGSEVKLAANGVVVFKASS